MISEASLREFLMNVVCKQQSATVHDKQEEPAEQVSTPPSYDGKKPGVFAHYFKGKNKRTKKEAADNRYTKKKKSEEQDKKEKDVVVVEQEVDRLHIEDLTQKQDEKLDALFEKPKKRKSAAKKKTVSPAKEEMQEGAEEEKKPVKKTRRKKKAEPKAEQPKKETGKTIMTNMASDLFNDVIEPEAIVLHYEKADEDEETPDKATERRDS